MDVPGPWEAGCVVARRWRTRIAGGLVILLAGVWLVVSREPAAAWCRPVPDAARAAGAAKRGVGTWYFDGVDAALADVGVSWYYTWQPGTAGVSAPASAQFVPMIWGADMVGQAVLGDTLLGFNEPDVADQANMTVDRALTLWAQMVATGQRLGSPAVASNAAMAGGWLDRFMTGTREHGLRVDFVALHWYGSDFTDARAAALDLCEYLASVYDRYGKPIWLTEYALADFTRGVARATYPTRAQQKAFVDASVPMLDALPFVERYAWFALSDSGSGFRTGLYSDASTLTPAGAAYLSAGR
jgi:hypothetical protein